MPTVEVEGAQVAYRVDGQGPGLVLVHGTGADGQSNWGHLVQRFASDWTVVRPDYSGSGATQDAHDTLSVPILARQVLAAAEAAGAAPFDLVGYSLGAAVAVYLAAHYPDRVRSLVLLGGFLHGGDARFALEFGLWRDLIRTDRRALARVVLMTGFSPAFLASWTREQMDFTVEAILAGNDWAGMARQLDADMSADVRAEAAMLFQPTLVIGCAHDHMVPVAHARALAAAIAGASYRELDSGHLAPLECPDAFVTMVRNFLRP